MKQKLLASLLALAMVLSLAACGSSGQTTSGGSASSAPAASSASSEESTETQESAMATIESTVLVDQDGIVVTAQELVEDPILGTGVKLLIENNSSEEQVIQCDYAVVNNFMMFPLLFSADVTAGNKANDTLYFLDSVMEGAPIETVADMSFVFSSTNPDTFQKNFTTEEISLPTSASGSYEQPIPDEGQELYNQNGFRIVGKYVEEDTLWGAGMVLFVENTSGSDILLTSSSMSINGFMVTPYFSTQVNDGRVALTSITILSTDLEANGIETVENIELSFTGIDPASFTTVFETGPIAFSAAA